MLVTCKEMRNAEEAAFARGILAADLMEAAGRGIAEIVRRTHGVAGTCVVFCGKGNNAGDGLVAARHLRAWGWEILVYPACGAEVFSSLSARHFQALQAPLFDRASPGTGSLLRPLVILDGLLGIGARGEPRGAVAEAIDELNQMRQEAGAWVLAIDLPSGLDGDSGLPGTPCVVADFTVAIAGVKKGLVEDAAVDAVGRLEVLALSDLDFPGSERGEVATAAGLRSWLPSRRMSLHKGNCGRVGIIAGSPGYIGAACLCSAAAVRAGAGLVTLYAQPDIAELLSVTCIPEVMVRTVSRFRDVGEENLDVLAVGPGSGRAAAGDLLALMVDFPKPLVIDADGLNILSSDIARLKHCRGPRVLTPHPGEMERLFPSRARTRRQWVEDFLQEYPVSLLLKGARTLVGGEQRISYNPTGNPGMASGGMGDVLTGVCAALIPQIAEEQNFRAPVLGAWLCGRAAEKAVSGRCGAPESLTASDVVAHLGAAFRALREDP